MGPAMNLTADFRMKRARIGLYSGTVVLAWTFFTLWLDREVNAEPKGLDLVTMGREVYISEGCMHCHSQFVRPEGIGQDAELWGRPTSVEVALSQTPVLIGNRRQGPDLANVGERRNSGWNRLHLIAPAAVVPGSRMPSFRYLFEPDDARGVALLAYLEQLRSIENKTDKSEVEGHRKL